MFVKHNAAISQSHMIMVCVCVCVSCKYVNIKHINAISVYKTEGEMIGHKNRSFFFTIKFDRQIQHTRSSDINCLFLFKTIKSQEVNGISAIL